MIFLRRSLVGIFLMALTLALLAYAGRLVWNAVDASLNAEAPSFPARERVLSVNVVRFTPEAIAPEMTVFGELRSQRTLALRASSGGTVIEVSPSFVEGGVVLAGDRLVRIDPAEAEAALARVRADLSDAEAEMRDAERSLTLSQDELSGAEGQAVLYEQALARQRDLQDRGVGTAPLLEAAELAASNANQSVLSARAAVAQAQARIDQAATLIERSRIDLSEAERTLADTEVFAAFDGVLSEVVVGPGGRVTANEQIAQLIDPAALEVAFRLSTAQYAQLLGEDADFIGTPVTVALDVAGVSLIANGRITREGAGAGEGQTGRVIFATIDAAPGLRPGDFVTVKVQEPMLDDVALLPASALGADGTLLIVSPEERLESVAVELLRRQGDDVIVRAAGLADARVVTERSPMLGAGILVRPIGDESAVPDDTASARAEMIELTDERRARLVAFVQDNDGMPAEAKTRILTQLEEPLVPSEMITRLESRMGI